MIFERIQEALYFWRQHLGAIALVVVPFSLLAGAVELLTGPALAIEGEGQEAMLSVNGAGAAWAFLAPVLTEAVLIPQLAAIQSGRARGLGDCVMIGATVLPMLIIIKMVTSAAMFIGLMFLILPGIWIYARLSLAPFIAVLEGLPAREALKQSFIRTDAVQWALLGAWMLTLLGVLSILNIIGALVIQLLGNHGGSQLLLSLLLGLGAALLHVLLFRFYGLTRGNPDSTFGNNVH